MIEKLYVEDPDKSYNNTLFNLNLTKSKVNKIIDWINKQEDKPKERWKPEEGDLYYTIDFGNEEKISRYDWVNDDEDKRMYESGVVFPTEEQAKEAAKKVKDLLLNLHNE